MSNAISLMMHKLAARFAHSNQSRNASLAGPFTLRFAGEVGEWCQANDGKSAVFTLDYLPDASSESEAEKVSPFFALPEGQPQVIDLAELKRWAGPAVWTKLCSECGGLAKTSPHVHCEICDGDGEEEPPVAPGWLFGAPLNRVYLARILEPFYTDGTTDGTVEVYIDRAKGAHSAKIHVVAERWRIVVIGMDIRQEVNPDTAEQFKDAPRLPTAVVDQMEAVMR